MKKTLLLIAAMVLVYASPLRADSPDSGIYLGGTGFVQWIEGTGSWSGFDFSIDKPLDNTEDTMGFNWSDKLMLGVKPMIGLRFSPGFALQAGYAMNISKSSNQTVADTDFGSTYEQGYTTEWEQRSIEVIGIIHPDSDLGYFFFGGAEFVSVDMSFNLYEGIQYPDMWGNSVSDYEYNRQNDDLSTIGIVLGAGVEFASNNNTSVFATAQYSTAKTDETFFGTDEFKVGIGGISFQVGLHWFPFGGSD